MGAFKIFGLSRALILSCVRPVVVIHAYHEDDDEDQNNSNMEEFNRKRLALEKAYKKWRPTGEGLVQHLYQSADNLDNNQTWETCIRIGTGVIGILGMTVVHFTDHYGIGTLLILLGTASGMLTGNSSSGQKSFMTEEMNERMTDHDAGYKQFQQAHAEFSHILLKCLEHEFHLPKNKGYYNQESANKIVYAVELVKAAADCKSASEDSDSIRNMSYPKLGNFWTLSERTRAQGIRDSIDVANQAGAHEVIKVTNSKKTDEETVKSRKWDEVFNGVVWFLSTGSIIWYITEMTDFGNITEDAKRYRQLADNLKALINEVKKLPSAGC